MLIKEFDTIAAIATPVGIGGIAVIRVSGSRAETAVGKIVFARNGKPLNEFESHKLTLSDICRTSDGSSLDEALVSVMRAPNSYTGETVVEINCHGGWLSAQLILEELFGLGIRQAEAGEFTRRAFVNGKIDLARAEAVIDLIHANSELGQSNAAKALSGKLSKKVNSIRDKAVSLAANLSAVADFPDEIDDLSHDDMLSQIDAILNCISEMLSGFKKGKILRDGVCTVIAGRPNVGKSSLLNALSRTERAIVTDIPGTTRDVIEEYVNVRGVALRLIDTAGIRNSDNSVEKIGIEKARETIESADLCLFVLDCSEDISNEDLEIWSCLKNKNVIVILNKSDKGVSKNIQYFSKKLSLPEADFVYTSALKPEQSSGIHELESRIVQKFLSGGISKDDVFISNDRQRSSLLKAQKAAENMKNSFLAEMPHDLLYVDLEEVISALGEITGLTVQDEIIDEVFERFCVGK